MLKFELAWKPVIQMCVCTLLFLLINLTLSTWRRLKACFSLILHSLLPITVAHRVADQDVWPL